MLYANKEHLLRKMKTVLNPNERKELKVGNVAFRSVYDHRVTEDDLKQARLELSETEEKKTATLLELKDALISDKKFHYRLDDEYLIRYLRYRKYDVKKAYSTIRQFYEYRKERPEIFDIRSNLECLLRQEVVRCLPYRDEAGCIIYWADTNKWKLDEMSMWDVLMALNAIADVVTMNPSNQTNGTISFWDVGGLTARHISHVAYPSVLRIILKSFQSIYPWRVKRIIVFNCNAVIRGFYNAFRYLLSKKIADRVILLGNDINELHRFLNPLILPKMYGGCIEECDCSITQYIKDNLPYIKYERSFGPNTDV